MAALVTDNAGVFFYLEFLIHEDVRNFVELTDKDLHKLFKFKDCLSTMRGKLRNTPGEI